MRRALRAAVALLAASWPASAQTVDLGALIPAGGATASGRIIELVAILTVLSVAPGLLIMVTSFTRFIVALSFLRSGLGLQSAPANLVLISLSLFMTFFLMAPTFDRAWQNGLQPMMDNKISQEDALAQVIEPFREFMLSQVREKDMALFESLSQGRFETADRSKADLRLLIPRLHDFRAPSRFRDRLPDRLAVPRHRHDRRDADHVDGHDDAAAFGHLAAGQDPVLRPDRRLEPADRQPGALRQLIIARQTAANRGRGGLFGAAPRAPSGNIAGRQLRARPRASNGLRTSRTITATIPRAGGV
jgi:flagellar biosynthetic protein FliP